MPNSDQTLAARIHEAQTALLRDVDRFYDGNGALPQRIRNAFLDTPRHRFAPRYHSPKLQRWADWREEDLGALLGELYGDYPLGIFADDRGEVVSTISQPSLVLYMLDLLELEPGQRVFELGGGSGWNAAMIGRLVGPEGRVCSVEIIPDLVATARAAIHALGLENVTVAQGDGNEGHAALAPYQRGVFTAAAWDLPRCFFEQIEDGGRLLLVVRLREGADLLAVLRKTGPTAFASEQHFRVSFVPVVGAGLRRAPPPQELDQLPDWTELKRLGDRALSWKDLRVSRPDAPRAAAFVGYVKDCQQSFQARDAEYADVAEEFRGWRDPSGRALTLFNDDGIRILGDSSDEPEIAAICRAWTRACKPSIEDLALSIHASGHAPALAPGQWLVERGDSAFLWSIG